MTIADFGEATRARGDRCRTATRLAAESRQKATVEVDDDQAVEASPRCRIIHAVHPASRALRVGTPMAYGHP